MRALDAAAVGVVLTVAVQAPASFQALTGAVIGIRTHADGGGDIQDVRDAEVISAVVVGLVGVAGAVVLKSPVPIIAALLADAVMVGVYEYALRTQHCTYAQGGSNGTGTASPDGY